MGMHNIILRLKIKLPLYPTTFSSKRIGEIVKNWIELQTEYSRPVDCRT